MIAASLLPLLLRVEYMMKIIISARGIADFIAGMTDSYAMRKYRRIFKL